MQVRINLYAVPRSFQVMKANERKEYSGFLKEAIAEQIEIIPQNNAIAAFLPFQGKVKVSIHWGINTSDTDKFIEKLNWGDIDNVAKPIIDALQGRIIDNDRQIVELKLVKHSLKDFDLTDRPASQMTYAVFAANKAVLHETDFVFIEVSDVKFHI